MKAVLSNWRYYVMAVVFGIGVAALFSVPENDIGTWMAEFIASKAIGAALCYAWYRMLAHWHRGGRIPELSRLINEEL